MQEQLPEYAAIAVVFLFFVSVLALLLLRMRRHNTRITSYQQKSATIRQTNQALLELIAWERRHPETAKSHPEYQKLLGNAIAALRDEVVTDPFDTEARARLLQLELFRSSTKEDAWNSLS